jgi:glyoxylase-like metal-dependent hydrolase (beta-lactamase superfamily II)
MRIHAIQTGTVSIKVNQTAGRGRGPLRVLNTLFAGDWTRPLPILAWAIEHPEEGLIVVDTGESARSSQPGYFPYWQPYFRLAVRVKVRRDEEIGPRLRALGHDPAQARVVLTHLHTDHAGGIYHFPGAEFLVSRKEYRVASGPLAAANGYLRGRWPGWFRPTPLELDEGPFGPFERSQRLTADGTVRVVTTPGHTAGHVSVVVREEDGGYVFLAGDTSYDERLMLAQQVDGVTTHVRAARRTLAAIKRFAEAERVVYLPSHDPGSVERLARRIPVGGKAVAVDSGTRP